MGRGIVETGLGRTERLEVKQRTTDPATTQQGEMWLRTDLAPATDQIATLRVDNGSGTWDVPVFDATATVSNVEKVLRVPVAGTVGFVPVTTASAAFPDLRFQHNGSTLQWHDSLEASVIPDSGNLHARYDFSQEDGSLPVTDQTGNGFDLTQGSYSGVGATINGVQAGEFDNVDDVLTAATASDWTFLHDGSQFSVYIVISNDAVGDEYESILGTSDISGSQVGYSVARDNRSGVGSSDRYNAGFQNGAGNPQLLIQEDGELPSGNSILATRHETGASPEHEARRNGTVAGSASDGTAYATGDPEHPLRLGGNLGGNGLYFGGEIGEVLIYETHHDDTTRNEVESFLSDKWGIAI